MPSHPPFVNIFFHHHKQVQIHQSFSFPCNIFQAIPNAHTSLLEYRNQKSKRLVFHQTCLHANLLPQAAQTGAYDYGHGRFKRHSTSPFAGGHFLSSTGQKAALKKKRSASNEVLLFHFDHGWQLPCYCRS